MSQHATKPIPLKGWPQIVAQASAALGDLHPRPTHDVLALRVYILHWALDGILRMRGPLLQTPPVAERDAAYRRAFEMVNTNGPAEWREQIASLYQDPDRDGPGVRTLVLLLFALELLNADCRRRFAHRTTRSAVEAWRRGEGDSEQTLYALTRKWEVFGKQLEAWYTPPTAPLPPARDDTRSAKAEAWVEHDGRCLDALTEAVAAYDAAVADVTAGDVTIPALRDGPFAVLYPVRKPWWQPIAARLCAENVKVSLAAHYAGTDDTIERYPLKALDRLRAHHTDHEAGRLPLQDAVSLGARLRTGIRKGRTVTATPEPNAPPPPVPPDYAERLEAFVSKTWGRRMWNALKRRIQDPRTSWEAVATAAGIPKDEMLRRRRILKEWAAAERLR